MAWAANRSVSGRLGRPSSKVLPATAALVSPRFAVVGVDVLVANWFKDKELGLAYGLLQAAGQAGSFAAFYGIPALLMEAHYGYVAAYYVGLLFAVVAVACLFVGHALEQVSIAPAVAVLGDELTAAAGAYGADAPAGGAGSAAAAAAMQGGHEPKDALLAMDAGGGGAADPDALKAAASGRLAAAGVGSALRRKRCSSSLAVALGLHHLVGLRVDFWLVIVGIAAYSGSYYTFMGEQSRAGKLLHAHGYAQLASARHDTH